MMFTPARRMAAPLLMACGFLAAPALSRAAPAPEAPPSIRVEKTDRSFTPEELAVLNERCGVGAPGSKDEKWIVCDDREGRDPQVRSVMQTWQARLGAILSRGMVMDPKCSARETPSQIAACITAGIVLAMPDMGVAEAIETMQETERELVRARGRQSRGGGN